MRHETTEFQPTESSEDTKIRVGLFRAWATSTARAYWREWLDFAAWCRSCGHLSMPAGVSTVTEYLGIQSDTLAVSSLHRKLAAISCAHTLCGLASPTHHPDVREKVAQCRLRTDRERFRKAGLSADDIGRIAAAMPRNLQGDRDRCLILLGHATSMRRAELAALVKSDVDERAESLIIRHRPNGEGERSIVIPRHRRAELCPVTAYRRWIDAAGIVDGPLFRWVTRHGQVRRDGLSDKAVAIIVKRAVALVGKDPARFSANSLRNSA